MKHIVNWIGIMIIIIVVIIALVFMVHQIRYGRIEIFIDDYDDDHEMLNQIIGDLIILQKL
jgi:uncharacterized protein YxeA